jgi:WD40 repeat protein
MRANRSRALLAAAATAALSAALFAPTASADSLVYMKGGNVWISHGDGSNPRQVTGGPNTWSWPTEDDAGNILVAGGAEYVSAGVEDTAGSQIYRLNQQGASLAAPQQTPGSMSTVGCVTYAPVSLRVAPDGVHYAYDSWFCDHFITQIGTVGGQGMNSGEYMSDFQFPYWVDNSDFVVSRGGPPLVDSDGEWWVHDLGDSYDHGFNWFGDPATYAGDPGGWATGYDGIAVSRDGTKAATVEEDGANWGGAAHKVVIRLWSAGGAPTPAHQTVPTPTFKCEFDLGGDPSETFWYYNAGPTFSPDGTRLAFALPDGIYIANVSNLDDCNSVTASRVIPDATQPYWSAADEAANAGYVAPANNNGNTTTHDTTAPVLGAVTMRPSRFAVAKQATPMSAKKRRRSPKGSTVRYTLSEPATVTLTVQQSLKGHKKGRRCVKGSKRHARSCTLVSTKGTLTRSGQSGANQLGFSGRLGRRKLSPGSYTLVVRATDSAGNRSRTKTLHFTILRH